MIDADDRIRCPECGHTDIADSFFFIEEEEIEKISEAQLVEAIERILDAHDRREALDDLADLFRCIAADVGLAPLIGEALDAARRGDWAAGELTLRRVAYPKWQSPRECMAAYEAARAEQRKEAA